MKIKKGKDDELDDIDSDEMLGGMAMGGPQFPGMMQPPGQQTRMGPSTEQMAALAPKTQRQLPPSSEGAPDGIKTCGSCSEKNPSENKFCQSCGGKL
jgi:membrane protease subunit (stomatin/prohibitin family)